MLTLPRGTPVKDAVLTATVALQATLSGAAAAAWQVVDLLIRLWLAQAFFVSGILKLMRWDTALYLARHEYPVPWLGLVTAAVAGVVIEVAAPVLLAPGLATRHVAVPMALLAFVAQVEYRATDTQLFWIALLIWYAVVGAGPLSLDNLLRNGLRESALPLLPRLIAFSTRLRTAGTPVMLVAWRVWLGLTLGLAAADPAGFPQASFAAVPGPLAAGAGAALCVGCGVRYVPAALALWLAADGMMHAVTAASSFVFALLALPLLRGAGPWSIDRASVAAVTHTYDNNGNLTGDGTWTFGYDAENRLMTATKTGVSASYLYDPFGRREQKTVGGVVTKYLLDGGAVVEEYNGANVRTARYVYAPGVDEPIYMERGANRYFYHFDGNGSVAALTGVAGAVSERYAYGPCGETSSTTSVGNPYRYTGQELDAETGLYYYRARYYSQTLGRFLQPDPIGYEDGLNLYAYVGNDPLNLLDPSGLLARETATKAYGVYNSLASGLISQPSLLPAPLPAKSGMSVIDAFRSNTHEYVVNTPLCSRCAPQAQSELYYAQYPFQGGVKVTPPMARDILSTSSLAITVTETRNPNGTTTLTNITQPTHILFDGRVARSITTLGDDSYATTRGTGSHNYGVIAALNQLLGPLLFQGVDGTLKDRIGER